MKRKTTIYSLSIVYATIFVFICNLIDPKMTPLIGMSLLGSLIYMFMRMLIDGYFYNKDEHERKMYD